VDGGVAVQPLHSVLSWDAGYEVNFKPFGMHLPEMVGKIIIHQHSEIGFASFLTKSLGEK
jgi:hypothetical protein